ncbi:MAG: TlpA family protein disulfide reductase [Deltaproteobacteria bacterium]|nr:TlpA family protein disulfide reductase [Deltaproteobacteria bacterium]
MITRKVSAVMKAVAAVILLVIMTAGSTYAGMINEKAPDISLNDLKDKAVTLDSFKGKVVFLDFWASWCGPCKQEFPEINRFISKYRDKDVVVLAVNVDKQRSHVEEFLSKIPNLSEKVTVVLDPDSKVVSSYNARMMPTSFIIDKNGIVRYIHFGFNESDPASWITEVDGLLKQ